MNLKSGKTFTGSVISTKMTDTIVVALSYRYRHPLYRKIVSKTKKLYAQNNLQAKVGDRVIIRECRPLSKTKRFITLEIITKNASIT